VLSHELRNPLAPIRTSAALLRNVGADATTRGEIAAIIDRQTAHMTRLIDDLLDVSRVTRGVINLEREDGDLVALTRLAMEQVAPLIETRQHEVDLLVPPQAVPVCADGARMVQVIGNLLNNAAKYTPKGGLIRVTVETHDDDAIVSVADNGCGIDAGSCRTSSICSHNTPRVVARCPEAWASDWPLPAASPSCTAARSAPQAMARAAEVVSKSGSRLRRRRHARGARHRSRHGRTCAAWWSSTTTSTPPARRNSRCGISGIGCVCSTMPDPRSPPCPMTTRCI
jgi:hypothetical protein